jgi:hypothetical protein
MKIMVILQDGTIGTVEAPTVAMIGQEVEVLVHYENNVPVIVKGIVEYVVDVLEFYAGDKNESNI